jgi:hypothetical protein
MYVPITLAILVALMGSALLISIALIVTLKSTRWNADADNPNLRPCPDCGRYISVRAAVCPSCGGPIKGI